MKTEPIIPREKFSLSNKEQAALQRILDWQEASAKCNMVFGPSFECYACKSLNNPNNTHCHRCGNHLG